MSIEDNGAVREALTKLIDRLEEDKQKLAKQFIILMLLPNSGQASYRMIGILDGYDNSIKTAKIFLQNLSLD